jgi:hypothetical protein
VLSQASVDVTDATEAPLQQACDLLDSFMAFFLLAPLLVPALWLAVMGCCSRGANDGRSSAPKDLRKFAAPLLPGGQHAPEAQVGAMPPNPATTVSQTGAQAVSMRTSNVEKYAVGQYLQNMGAGGVSGHVASLVADAGATGPGMLCIRAE